MIGEQAVRFDKQERDAVSHLMDDVEHVDAGPSPPRQIGAQRDSRPDTSGYQVAVIDGGIDQGFFVIGAQVGVAQGNLNIPVSTNHQQSAGSDLRCKEELPLLRNTGPRGPGGRSLGMVR